MQTQSAKEPREISKLKVLTMTSKSFILYIYLHEEDARLLLKLFADEFYRSKSVSVSAVFLHLFVLLRAVLEKLRFYSKSVGLHGA